MSVNLPNGLTVGYSFDDNGNLTKLDYKSSGTTLRFFDYGYDGNGMRTSMTDINGDHNYTYDSLYQILTATHPTVNNPLENFSYDEVGNWLTDNRVHNELNQLTEDDSCYYTYDADGNMTLKIGKLNNDTTVYSWNAENRLVGIEKSGMVTGYHYGPLGRRLAKTVNGIRKEYRYDGENLIMEMDVNNSIIASYTYGPGIDNPLMMNRENKNYFYIKDGLGSVTALTDSTANVVQEYTYSVFGKIMDINTFSATDTIENPFTYTSREWEPEVGLYYYRNRFYDAGIGRFISEDSLKFNSGDYNFYRYVNNTPTFFTDPTGNIKLGDKCYSPGRRTTYNFYRTCKKPCWGWGKQLMRGKAICGRGIFNYGFAGKKGYRWVKAFGTKSTPIGPCTGDPRK